MTLFANSVYVELWFLHHSGELVWLLTNIDIFPREAKNAVGDFKNGDGLGMCRDLIVLTTYLGLQIVHAHASRCPCRWRLFPTSVAGNSSVYSWLGWS